VFECLPNLQGTHIKEREHKFVYTRNNLPNHDSKKRYSTWFSMFGCLANLKETHIEDIFRGKEDILREENTKYYT